jgi:hypothetical protein
MKTQRGILVGVAVHGFALLCFSICSPAQTADPPPPPKNPVPHDRLPQVNVPPPVQPKGDSNAPTQNRLPQTLPGGMIAPPVQAKKKEPVVIPDRKITTASRMDLIRGMNAELGFARKPFPMGKEGLKVDATSGKVTPETQQLEGMMAGYGPAIKIGDRARITDVKIKDKSIVFDINGGPVKKKKWYEHIEISGGGGAVSPGQPTDNTNVRGSFVELTFAKFVPDLTTEQVKQLLEPVLNFRATSAAEAYLETIPPAAKKAISEHRALVGMNREMVTYAKGRPPQKHREKDGDLEYEEWIYGMPPQDVEFIRFAGDEVIRIETMKVTGEKEVRTAKEIEIKKEEPEVAQQQQPAGASQGPAQANKPTTDAEDGPKGRPSLKRPGEEVDQPPLSGPVGGPGPTVPPPRPTDNPPPPGADNKMPPPN